MSKAKLDFNGPDFERIKLEDIQTPKTGKICLGQRWWVTDGEHVFFYKKSSPQCNLSKQVLEHCFPEHQHIYIEMAFVKHNCRDYC